MTAASSESCSSCIFQKAYRFLIWAGSLLQSPLLLAIRLYWGWQFFQTGKGKLVNHDKVAGFFASLHIPFPGFNAYLTGSLECLGGLLLVIGLASRLISVPLIFTLCIAYLTAESDSLKHIFNDPDKFTSSAPFLFLFVCLIILAFGPGKFSADWILAKTRYKNSGAGN